MHITRVLANEQRLERSENGRQAGSEEAFSQTLQSLICLNPHEGPIEIAFDYGSLQADNLQKSPTFVRSMGRGWPGHAAGGVFKNDGPDVSEPNLPLLCTQRCGLRTAVL